MSTVFSQSAQTARQLFEAVGKLEQAAESLGLAATATREWHQTLRHKLLPQLADDAFLVVAVVGGTNIGKSVIFNHIAGSRVSATSPLASRTRHPVCLVPAGFEAQHDLQAIFEGFRIERWTQAEQAFDTGDEDRLFWRTCDDAPANLLVLDTPDIDSQVEINWHRADMIRRAADVLIAVLTQQKYNDAAVKQFFRKASAEDKSIIVLFNQCELPADDAYWPLWLDTFCSETHIVPQVVYVVPGDRSSAERNGLPFYECTAPGAVGVPAWESEAEGTTDLSGTRSNSPTNLRDELSRLRFAEIKLRTLRGSLDQVLDDAAGVPGYLGEIRGRSEAFVTSAQRLSSENVVPLHDWPSVPNRLLVAEIRTWWNGQREGWSRQVNSFYDMLGRTVYWPLRFARDKLKGDRPVPPWDAYRKQEWAAVLHMVEEMYDKLDWLRESGSELLRPFFQEALAGKSRVEMLGRLKSEHDAVDLSGELAATVNEEMQSFQSSRPEMYRFYRRLNEVSAAVRPMTSVVLFSLGWGPAGDVVAPFVADAAMHTMAPIVAHLAGGTAVAVMGESAITGTAEHGAGLLQAKFQKLQSAFATRRVAWLAGQLRCRLLGSLPERLRAASQVPASAEFQEVARLVAELKRQLGSQP